MTQKSPNEMMRERSIYAATGTVCAWLTLIFFAWIATWHPEDIAAVVTVPRVATVGFLTICVLLLRR